MLPGKTFTPDDVLAILRRRYWFILLPFAVVSAATTLYTGTMPNLYRSEALIALEAPQVPTNMIPAVARARDLEDRIPAIRNQILSRTRLERIIQDLDLYPDERRTGQIMEDIVERMRGEITVTPVAGSAIRVGFIGRDPRTVQRVAERVSGLFIDESTRDRRLQLQSTDQFLETSLRDAENRLIERERALAVYRRQHAGELPEQLNANLQALQTHQMDIQNLTEANDRGRERRLTLEQTIEALENQGESLPTDSATATGQQLTAARAALVQAQLTYTADHPEVGRLRQVIRNLEATLEEEARESPVSASRRVLSPAEQTRQRRLQEARDSVAELDRQITRNEEAIGELRRRVAEYLRRAEAAPTRQTEMVGMNRDYSTLSQVYTNLLSQKEQSNIAANLERREIGEQFRQIDQARVPATPFSPQRERLNLMGMVAGLGLGLLIVGLLEYRDSTFRTDEELSQVIGIPVFAVIPLMLSDKERKRAWRRRAIMATIFGGVVVGCLGIVAYVFVR